ncbi:MAG: GDP-L-fucose synthase [Spirochaetales bacterium]
MEKNAKIYVAGHRGLVGSAILKQLEKDGYTNIITRTHSQLDLTQQTQVNEFFESEKPDYVFLAAAKVGGIGANSTYPADFIYLNMMIGFNVVHAAYKTGVKKLLNLGSSCIYPKMATQPITEESLLTGALESTNDAYALAKISVIKLCTAYNIQHGTNYLSAMPTNLYGPGDNYDLHNSHVLPAIIRKFHEAKITETDTVTLWGDGSPFREFLYSEDVAAAVIFLMNEKNASDMRIGGGQNPVYDFINIGSGSDLSIKELADIVHTIVYADCPNRTCTIHWDTAKPNGTPKKLMDCAKLFSLGFSPSVSLEEGIKRSYADYTAHHA